MGSSRRCSRRCSPLFGPTGIGKTDLALALADRLRAAGERPVAVSADALQVYRGLEILTGVATAAQRERLEHRLVGVLPVTERFSAGRYARLAHAEIDGLLAQGAAPIVVGGTGLYLRAALADLALRPAVPEAVRAAVDRRPRGARARPRCTPSWRAAPRGRPRASTRPTATASSGRSSCTRLGALRPAAARQRAVDRPHPPPDAARRPDDATATRSTPGSTRA